jgi:putative phosphoesterase
VKIAILSDIHDHIDNLKKAISMLEGSEAIILCGDITSPFTVDILKTSNIPVFACFGNNDADQTNLVKRGGKRSTWFSPSEEYGHITLDNKKIAFSHYPNIAKLLLKTNEFDAIFFGHTHQSFIGNDGKTLIANPGAICGINPQKLLYERSSFAIYTTDENTCRIIEM